MGSKLGDDGAEGRGFAARSEGPDRFSLDKDGGRKLDDPSAPDSDAAELIAMARYIRSCRNLRNEMFGVDFFGDPAWDMLLDLFIGESVCRAGHARGVSPKTALRWEQILEMEGLVERLGQDDLSNAPVALTEKGATLMHDYLQRAARIV